MANKAERIILDSNLWISFLITKDFTKLDTILFSKQAILLFSNELLDEFITVVKRPKFKKYFNNSDITSLISIIEKYAEFVSVKNKLTICRDEKDNFLLSLAKEGNADYLITGDNDLLSIKKLGQTKIITITEYLAIL